jgi:hypothetical protein
MQILLASGMIHCSSSFDEFVLAPLVCLFLVSGFPDGQLSAWLISDQCSISWLTSSRLLLAGNSLLVLFVGCEHYRVLVLPGLLLLFNAAGMSFSFRR